MTQQHTIAMVLIIPLLTMIKPAFAYWREYKTAQKKNNIGMKAKYGFLFYLFVVGVFGMWLSWLYAIISMMLGEIFTWFGWGLSSNKLASLIQVVGVVIFIVGAVTYNLTIIYAGRFLRPAPSGTLGDHRLIDKGPFSLIRHPLYVSYFLIAIGLSLIVFNYLPLLFALFIGLGIYPTARAEEKVLVTQLGETYINYQKRVGMFFPKQCVQPICSGE